MSEKRKFKPESVGKKPPTEEELKQEAFRKGHVMTFSREEVAEVRRRSGLPEVVPAELEVEQRPEKPEQDARNVVGEHREPIVDDQPAMIFTRAQMDELRRRAEEAEKSKEE